MPSLFKRSIVGFSLFLVLFCAAPYVHADAVNTFDVSGSLFQGGTFSGTITIDVTSGTVEAIDLTFPGLAAFTALIRSSQEGPDWTVVALNDLPCTFPDIFNCWFVDFAFSTAPTPGSLVGFTGGTIIPGSPGAVIYTPTDDAVYNITVGRIVPASTATPEPSSLLLILAGAGLVSAMRKRSSGLQRAS